MNEDFVDLDFLHGLPTHSFVDKKNGVKINMGRVSTVPDPLKNLNEAYGGILLGIQESGISRDRLDNICNKLAADCENLNLAIAIVKSDRPFDSQWYFFGNIESLLQAAEDSLIQPPFAHEIHENIIRAIKSLAG